MHLAEITVAVCTLKSTEDELRTRLDAMQVGQLDWTPDADHWSPHEVIGHMADVELAFAFRMRLILAEDHPGYPGFDEDAWTTRENHAEKGAATLYAAWQAIRRWNIALIGGMTSEDLRRVGHHSKLGEQTLQRVIEYLAAHDCYHIKRLDQLAAHYEEARA